MRSLLFMGVVLMMPGVAMGHSDVKIYVQGDQRCVESNGLPDHRHGSFPRRGNPHSMKEQNIRLCLPLNPQKTSQPTQLRSFVGIALNGVSIKPGTADYYDWSSKRGHSRDPSSGWNLEGIGARQMLGMDMNNAHVDERGLYHYHGIPEDLVKSLPSSLIGYAADGFEIHYVGGAQTSSYRLKEGRRPSGPGGRYDGTYVEDWDFVTGSGTLDQCNGGMLDGKFVYFATDTFPFFPRCVWGQPSPDFMRRGGGMRRTSAGGGDPTRNSGPSSGRRGPPQEAIDICRGQSEGAACTFTIPSRGHTVSGTCGRVRSGDIACKPQR